MVFWGYLYCVSPSIRQMHGITNLEIENFFFLFASGGYTSSSLYNIEEFIPPLETDVQKYPFINSTSLAN
mgnify:CR=1 FL=1